jgi:hypothetical protein
MKSKLPLSAIMILMILWTACWSGLRINGAHSFPVGFISRPGNSQQKVTWFLLIRRRFPFSGLLKNEGISMSPTAQLRICLSAWLAWLAIG